MKRYLEIGLLLIGMGLVASAILTKSLVTSVGPAWAGGRILLLSSGLLVVALGVWVPWRERMPGGGLPPDVAAERAENSILEWIRVHALGIGAVALVLLTLAIYAFLGSTGTWRVWPETSRYYDDLGAALRVGRLNLGIQPPASLLALPDPYDPPARNRVPGLRLLVDKVWDLSFYKGKFYAYWGPVPGLLLALVKFFHAGPVADQYVTCAFLSGLLVMSVVLLLRVRGRHYRDIPLSLVLVGLAVIALAYPIPWMLSHAAVYEASVAAGQFFLIGGTYFAYVGLEQEQPSALGLCVASIFWTLAIGSRLLLVLPVAFLACTVFRWAMSRNRAVNGFRTLGAFLAALGFPLLAGGLGLALYNWLRFGSVLETGVRYMLTSENLQRFYSETFRTAYVGLNLRLYLVNPFKVQSQFPFILPLKVPPASLPVNPGIYHVEQITGLVYAIPFALFAALAVVAMVCGAFNTRERAVEQPQGKSSRALAWLALALTGSTLLSFIALLPYFYVAIRFLADLVPSLILLSVLGMWEGYRYFRNHRATRLLYGLVGFTLAIASVAISLLLTMAESYQQFASHNPHLMEQIVLLFRH